MCEDSITFCFGLLLSRSNTAHHICELATVDVSVTVRKRVETNIPVECFFFSNCSE